MSEQLLTLTDAVLVAVQEFDIDPDLARIEFEQKCYISNDKYLIGYQNGLADAIKAIEAWNRRAE